MPFFSLKKALTPPKGRTPGETFLRFMLLITIFAGAGYLYTVHFNRTMDFIESRQSINDETKTLTADQKQAFRDFAKLLKGEFGLELRLRFVAGPAPYPELDNKTVFIGVDTADKSVEIVLPPLVEQALGPGYLDWLKNEHYPPFFADGRWARGTAEALADMWQRLIRIKRPEQEPDKKSDGAAHGQG